MSVSGRRKQTTELAVTQMQEFAVITTFHIHFGLIFQAVVHQHFQSVGAAGRRDRSRLAIPEQCRGSLFRRKTEPPVQQPVDLTELQAAIGRNDCHQKPVLVLQDD